MMNMGPNNMSGCVIWALGLCFSFFSSVILCANNNFYYNQVLFMFLKVRMATATNTGPNDASRHAIWALGM